jgi:16S rRNA U1498 N3-methylase RsmE
MQRRRFYAMPDAIGDSVINLSPDESHHLMRVLRLRTGDEAFAFDGYGREYRCRVASVEAHRARLAWHRLKRIVHGLKLSKRSRTGSNRRSL